MYAIEISKLTKYYGRTRGVLELGLAVEPGEFFGFIGPNGAGKSTTIRTLLGLIRPTAGSALVFGREARGHSRQVLDKVGYLPAEAAFYPGMRVREVLALSARLRGRDLAPQGRALCERLQLDPERRVEELSFGNRKKVAIVCALQSDPPLLILDEPTSGLDPLMQREFFDILKERSARGDTVFLSSHVLSEVQRNCTRAAIIRKGRLIACDTVEALARTNARRVTIRGSAPLDGLPGVRNRVRGDGGESFLYSGDMGPLLRALAAGQIADLSVSEPDLEEIFLHYYETEGEGHDAVEA